MTEKPLIIFDTDMDTDCDDAGALLMLINAHLRGEITLLGVGCDSVCEYAAPFTKTVLDRYGLDIPVGEIYGHANCELDEYLKHQANCASQAYNKMLAKRYDGIPCTAELYASLLRGVPDKSVTLLCVGLLSAVYEFLKNEPDLFEKKVKQAVIMGNPYKKNDFNLSMDAKAAKGFFDLCPCPVYISYLGGEIITGNRLDKALPAEHPVRRAYEIWSCGKGRSSWDLLAALFAINPIHPIFRVEDACKITYDENERVSIITDGTRDRIITLSCTNPEAEEILNAFLV